MPLKDDHVYGGFGMKIYYVSHPYGGKQKNEAKADEIVRALQTEYPNICFVSPIHAIRCSYSKTDYILGLDYCLELLRRCDGIVMCGKWKESIGCVAEYMLARELCKDVKTAHWPTHEGRSLNEDSR